MAETMFVGTLLSVLAMGVAGVIAVARHFSKPRLKRVTTPRGDYFTFYRNVTQAEADEIAARFEAARRRGYGGREFISAHPVGRDGRGA